MVGWSVGWLVGWLVGCREVPHGGGEDAPRPSRRRALALASLLDTGLVPAPPSSPLERVTLRVTLAAPRGGGPASIVSVVVTPSPPSVCLQQRGGVMGVIGGKGGIRNGNGTACDGDGGAMAMMVCDTSNDDVSSWDAVPPE